MFDEVLELLKDTLKGAFSRDTERKRTRKIIFWYDSKQEYQDFINELELEDTEIIKYDNNSFWIRYHIEKEELNKNIIIYLPFERKKGIDNDLLDLETSNSDLLFNPDSTTMRLKNLGLTEDCRNVIKKYAKFFGNKKRETEFKNFDIDEKNTDNIDLIITAILLNIKSINEDEILKEIVKYNFEDEKKYEELFKFGNEEFILGIFNDTFGVSINSYEELQEVYKSLVFTYFATSLKDIKKVSRYSKYLLTKKTTNVYVFINSLMRDKTTKEYFEKIAQDIEEEFGIEELLKSMDIEEYNLSDAFKVIDKYVIKYLVDKLFNGIGEYDIYKNYIDDRENKYWFDKLENEYNLLKVSIAFFEKIKELENAIKIVDIDKFAKDYADNFSEVDTLYRKMYFYYDNIEDKDLFINLKNKIENIYINDFMTELSIKWSDMIENLTKYDSNRITLQKDFYKNYIKPFNDKKDRIVVIVSDAFRYECAKELNNRLKVFASKSDIGYMQGLVPSYTKLGMAALLPNKELSRVQDSDDILVDGLSSSSIKDRQILLQNENPDSIAVKYDDLYDMTKLEWKKLFSGKKVVYIYHDTVDNAGEHNENTIFTACDKAINELEKLVRDLHTTFSGINAFITADHGFFYKRGKVENYEKTNKISNATKQKTRYSYSDSVSEEEGILSINLDYIFGQDSGYVNIPKGNIIYARQGTGINYVHGGILPQEIIIPVIDFKSSRTSDTSKKVGITYSGLSTKITNAITYLEFLQDNNVDDNNKPCRYLVHFEDESGNRISDECTIVANYENTEVKDRFFKEKFVFKNISYDKEKAYYLVIIDEETGIEVQKIKFYIDIAIVNNFDF
ncbi:MAG: BREX-1 system phosphatase PglZ type A [Clostridia bacterium]|nr:BREX-1 system phosphatase PglZ type A [Clostridia bacterium]